MGEKTERKSVDLTRSEGEAGEPGPAYMLVPINVLNGDPVSFEDEPNIAKLPGFARDSTDTIPVPRDGVSLTISGLGLKAIGHSLGVVSTFTGVAATSEYLLHLGGTDSAVTGLLAVVGGKVTLAVKRRKTK